MNKSAILEILDGKADMESLGKPKKAPSKISEEELKKELQQHISPQLIKKCIDYIDELSFEHCDEVAYYYREGFKLGLRIAVECLYSTNPEE